LHGRLVSVVVNPGTVCETSCDDCARTRVVATEAEAGVLNGETVIRVTVMRGCVWCEGSTTVI
jgi:hypothetical protein